MTIMFGRFFACKKTVKMSANRMRTENFIFVREQVEDLESTRLIVLLIEDATGTPSPRPVFAWMNQGRTGGLAFPTEESEFSEIKFIGHKCEELVAFRKQVIR